MDPVTLTTIITYAMHAISLIGTAYAVYHAVTAKSTANQAANQAASPQPLHPFLDLLTSKTDALTKQKVDNIATDLLGGLQVVAANHAQQQASGGTAGVGSDVLALLKALATQQAAAIVTTPAAPTK